jgi:hypothetical protein
LSILSHSARFSDLRKLSKKSHKQLICGTVQPCTRVPEERVSEERARVFEECTRASEECARVS